MSERICPKCGYKHVALRYRGPGIGRWFWRCLRDEQTGEWCDWGKLANDDDTVMAEAIRRIPESIPAEKATV